MSLGGLLIISCNDTDSRVDPAQYFNTTASTTQVIKTPGGRAEDVINNIYYADQANRISMIIVMQHTECTSSPGDTESNVRTSMQSLKSSPYIRNDISVIGYVLDTEKQSLREVNLRSDDAETQARQGVLDQMDDFAPYWN